MRRTLFVLVVLCACASAAVAQQVIVDICHRDGQGRYRTIRVAASAVAAHIKNHGDCVPQPNPHPDLCVSDHCDEVLGCATIQCDTPPGPCFAAGVCVPDTGRCFYAQLAAGESCDPVPPDPNCNFYTCDSDSVCTRRCVPESAQSSEPGSADMCMLNQSVLTAPSSPAGTALNLKSVSLFSGMRIILSSLS
jgi:hypothetical protein